jgi:hypothetical protein
LTAFELGAHGIPHTVIADNTGGHLMQRGLVDVCLVGSDRATATGDVANKIGTYLKALAACSRSRWLRLEVRSRTRRSTSRRPVWSRASSPNGVSFPRAGRDCCPFTPRWQVTE